MKVTVWRTHKVNPQPYESLDYGASISIDDEVDKEFQSMTFDEISAQLESSLDEMLDKPSERALALGGQMSESHITDFYEK